MIPEQKAPRPARATFPPVKLSFGKERRQTAIKKETRLPELSEIREEMERVWDRTHFRQTVKSTLGTVIIVMAVAVLIATVFLPVVQVTGASMQPNMDPGDILVIYKTSEFHSGEVCSFYYNNRLVTRRIIAFGGDVINISEEGEVQVNGRKLDEPYITENAFGMCDLELPYVVPRGEFFVLGDNRETAVDSRTQAFGCVAQEEVLGKVFLRVWPLNNLTFYGF